jgi:DNA invertase Pin-like site-specific DNA recombinase
VLLVRSFELEEKTMQKPNASRRRKRATPKLRYAIYARSASDVPTSASTSIAEQIRTCTEYAEKPGWKIIKESIETDVPASGVSLAGRHALRNLILATEKQPSRFDCVLSADTSRLSRNLSDCLYILKHFEKNGVEVVEISKGLVRTEHKTQLILLGLMDEQYLLDLSKRARARRTKR